MAGTFCFKIKQYFGMVHYFDFYWIPYLQPSLRLEFRKVCSNEGAGSPPHQHAYRRVHCPRVRFLVHPYVWTSSYVAWLFC